jgi:hypothetical protein
VHARAHATGARALRHLLDIQPMVEKMAGVVMELEDCAYPELHGV